MQDKMSNNNLGSAGCVVSGGVSAKCCGASDNVESEKEKGGAGVEPVEGGESVSAVDGGDGVSAGEGVSDSSVGFSGVRQMSKEKLRKLIQHLNGGRGEFSVCCVFIDVIV